MYILGNTVTKRIIFFYLVCLCLSQVSCTEDESSEFDCDKIYMRPGHGETFYEANPTYYDPNDDSAWLPKATPEEHGLNPEILALGLAELEQSPAVFSFLLLRHDAVIVEQYFNGSAVNHSNNIHSASKSMLSAFVGVALRDGYIHSLDQRVSDFLPEYFAADDLDKKNITLRHLLTMSAGLEWIEDYTEYEIEEHHDWIKAIIALPLINEPGIYFNYSTGLSHLMSAVLTRATNMSTCEFAHSYLFNFLEIDAEHWGRDPQGFYSGGYNLYMTPRELTAFCLLYLHKGVWNGASIIPEQWVEESCQSQMSVDEDYSYGYYWWLTSIRGYDVAIAWGYGGQFGYVIPSLDMVVVLTANTRDDYYYELDANQFIEDYIIGALS
ncbi:serine hydrolase domain-containing protein [candidate division CSSED10-310 bacterium]|uniref:Serine hydrolase domain-containing protein n=1 Tax=candidate division CSSED10-310 bacterium TaxID=2855610 RepID=A0ABV6Z4W9_UNCC1